MAERVLKDGSIDYGQRSIGPSLSDRNLAKRSEGSSLGNFRARNNFHVSDLTPVAIIAPFALAGCGISIGGENKGIRTESLPQHFDSFLQENGGKPNRQLMTLWTQSLGIPYEAVWQLDDHPLDVLDSPSIETSNYFQILEGNGLPTKGDIIIAKRTDSYWNGRPGIATGDVEQGNDGKLYEKALATDQSSGYPLLFKFPLDGIAGWLKPTEFIRFEEPDEIAGISEDKSISGLFDAFYYKYNRLYVEAEDDSPEKKFSPSDLVMAWADTLGIPRETLRYETSDQVLRERKEITDKHFEFIENWEGRGLLPKKGDIVVFDYADDSDDRMAIATGEGKVEEYAEVFTQGGFLPGNPSFNISYSLNQISGWLTPRNLPGSENSDTQVAGENVINAESEEGQALGAESKKSIDELFDNFVRENEGVHGERAPILLWLDTLRIPEETITEGYNAAGDLLNNPTDITEQSFEVILKTGDNKPKKGDIIILPPIEGDGIGEIGIATGETIENDWQGVFTTSATLDKFSYNQISGWLRPRGYDGLDSESGGNTAGTDGEVLGANTESVQKALDSLFDKWGGKGVELSDEENFRQCVDLIWAWLDEMKISRDSIRNFDPEHPYASQIYTNANDETRKYFGVFEYGSGMEILPGDIVVWGPDVGNIAGHVAIGTGDKDVYFSQNYPLEQDPERRIARMQEISTKGIVGILRPKGVESTPPATEEPGEFVPKNELELARYEIGGFFLDYLDQSGGGWHSYWVNSTNLSGSEKEKNRQKLAKGEKIDSTVFYETKYITHVFAYGRPKPTLFLYDDNGDIYEQELRVIKGELKNWGMSLTSDTDIPEARNGYRVVWSGTISFSGDIQAGSADIIARGTSEDLQRVPEQGSEFPGYEKITELSPTQDISYSGVPYHAYVYENGDVEFDDGNYNSFSNPLDGDITFLFQNIPQRYDYKANDEGYNEEFVVDLTS